MKTLTSTGPPIGSHPPAVVCSTPLHCHRSPCLGLRGTVMQGQPHVTHVTPSPSPLMSHPRHHHSCHSGTAPCHTCHTITIITQVTQVQPHVTHVTPSPSSLVSLRDSPMSHMSHHHSSHTLTTITNVTPPSPPSHTPVPALPTLMPPPCQTLATFTHACPSPACSHVSLSL